MDDCKLHVEGPLVLTAQLLSTLLTWPFKPAESRSALCQTVKSQKGLLSGSVHPEGVQENDVHHNYAGKAASMRGRRRHLLLLLVLLLPAVTGLAVMCIRLRSSETEHALIRPPSATAYAWRGPDDGVLLPTPSHMTTDAPAELERLIWTDHMHGKPRSWHQHSLPAFVHLHSMII